MECSSHCHLLLGWDRYSGLFRFYIAASYGLTLQGWHAFTTAGLRMKQKSCFKSLLWPRFEPRTSQSIVRERHHSTTAHPNSWNDSRYVFGQDTARASYQRSLQRAIYAKHGKHSVSLVARQGPSHRLLRWRFPCCRSAFDQQKLWKCCFHTRVLRRSMRNTAKILIGWFVAGQLPEERFFLREITI